MPKHFSILEEQINVELQMEYFNYSRDLKSSFSQEYLLEHLNDLLDPNTTLEEKKNLLVLLASLEKVEAFRTIEKYAKSPDPELKDWSILALQESRMVIQSSLMDEQQVYISTGLGGKGLNLRYFVVIVGREGVQAYSDVQQKIIKNEMEFSIKKSDGELEEIHFEENLAMALVLLPIKSDIQSVFVTIITECNQYGDFVRPDIVITNVKRMTIDEIRGFINHENE